MEKRKIGSLEVTVVGLGCNNFGWRKSAEESRPVVLGALDAGVNFFDTADVYGAGESEEFMGLAFGSRRGEAIIATKFGSPMSEDKAGARPEYVKAACNDSLKRLRTDYIDLYQIHRPDPETPIADTLGAMNELVKEGKVREIGCSNFSLDQLREAKAAIAPGTRGFASLQNDLSLLNRGAELDVVPECRAEGIAFLPFFPLYNGLLTGKYSKGNRPEGTRLTTADEGHQAAVFSEKNLAIVDGLDEYATSQGHTLLELAFARLLAEPAIASVIAGASTAAQITANAQAASWVLSADDVAAIDAIAPLG